MSEGGREGVNEHNLHQVKCAPPLNREKQSTEMSASPSSSVVSLASRPELRTPVPTLPETKRHANQLSLTSLMSLVLQLGRVVGQGRKALLSSACV